MANYRSLLVWQKAMLLVEEIYLLTRSMPKEELFSLTNQMRRSAVSIPSNISEGHGRENPNELYRFLSIAKGSVSELVTQLEICSRLNYFTREELEKANSLCSEVERMLYALMNRQISEGRKAAKR